MRTEQQLRVQSWPNADSRRSEPCIYIFLLDRKIISEFKSINNIFLICFTIDALFSVVCAPLTERKSHSWYYCQYRRTCLIWIARLNENILLLKGKCDVTLCLSYCVLRCIKACNDATMYYLLVVSFVSWKNLNIYSNLLMPF